MRPSLVIGLGGTGSWVAVHLKHRVLTDQRWLRATDDSALTMPLAQDHVDTTLCPLWIRAVDVDAQNRPVIDGLTLDVGVEDIRMESPVGNAIQHFKSLGPQDPTVYPTIERWLPRAEAAEFEITDAMKFMVSGAGQIRQFGRMALFLDTLNRKAVLSQLSDAVRQLTTAAGGRGELTIYVASSVGGGAGAGMLLDVLAFLQHERQERAADLKFRTFVFVALPGTFKGVLKPEQFTMSQANGRAALRELDRLVNGYRSVELEWQPERPVRLTKSVADTVYLIDGSRNSGAGTQLEGFTPPEHNLPVAIADAIYTHMFPSSGASLLSSYVNLEPNLVDGKVQNRYSTFGAYTVQYAWEPLMRSLRYQAADAILEQLLAPAQEDTRTLAESYLAGKAADTFTTEGSYERPPAVLADVLATPEAARGEIEPATFWLLPASNPVAFPDPPTLAEFFPGIRMFRTPYANDDLREETEAILARFWGPEQERWTDGEPQFHPVANTNQDRIERSFRKGLLLATAAVMNRRERIGGVRTGLDFLESVGTRLDLFGGYLDRVRRSDLKVYREQILEIQKRMQGGRGGSARDQREYLAAQQALLTAQIRDGCLGRAGALLGKLRELVEQEVRALTSWQGTLENLREAARHEWLAANQQRTNADTAPLRRIVPLPATDAERKLYAASVGEDDGHPLPERLMAALGKLGWCVRERHPELLLKHPVTGTVRSGGRRAPGDPDPITLGSFGQLVGPLFAGLPNVSVFEVLELSGTDADELVGELITGSAPLAAIDPQLQLKHTERRPHDAEKPRVFAHWLADGEGSALSMRLQSRLTDRGVTAVDLAALPAGITLPTRDKLIGFAPDHLIAMAALNGVEVLNGAYRDRRDRLPAPHVLPEEKGAARLEAASERLYREGLIGKELDFVHADKVALCRDEWFLQYVAAVVAGNRVFWDELDPVKRTGSWLLLTESGERHALGTAAEFGTLISGLLAGSDRTSKEKREALRQAGIQVMRDERGIKLLRSFAREGWSGSGKLDPTTVEVLQVAAAQFVASQD